MNAFLNGIGILSACGRGTAASLTALQIGWQPPSLVALPDGRELPLYPLPHGTLEDKSLGRKVRRADRLSKIAVFAAADALINAQLPTDLDRRRIGVIVSSALGSHGTTFQFLDEILTYGDAGVSPTVFSHSVQNAAAAYIASTLDLQGPVLTITQVHFAFHHALTLAQGWLASGRCDHVLIGGMDELGSVMQFIWRSLLPPAADGKIRPFAFGPNPGSVPGEGSAFIVLSSAQGTSSYARIKAVRTARWTAPELAPDLHILEADGTLPDESNYALAATSGTQLAAYSPLFGSMTGGTPFQLAVAALMLKEQTRFASPVTDSAVNLPVCIETAAGALESIHLTRLNCTGTAACIHLNSL